LLPFGFSASSRAQNAVHDGKNGRSEHGDFPLLASQGEMMAEAIGETSSPAILDTTRLKTGERMRFFTDFADTILRVNRGPLRLVIDEAHLFAPQAGTRGAGAMPDMLHAANNLISLGRSRGLCIVLISQRPAKVHKDTGATAPRRKTYRSWWNSEVRSWWNSEVEHPADCSL
jgi:hypothetical protein